MQRKFTVTVEMPEGVKVAEMADYIEDAVATHKGCMDPDEAIFGLDGTSVKVRPVPKPKPAAAATPARSATPAKKSKPKPRRAAA